MICSSAAICSFGCRALLKAAISSSACDTPSLRIWIGSVFFAGIEKPPPALSAFFVDSHQRFHSASVKTSPTSHSLICCAVALPSKLSRIFRTSAAGFSLAKFLIDARSVALRTRKCSGASGVRFSAAYWACIGCDFLPAKSITIWLSSRFHSLTRPNPQLLCKQNVPGLSFSSCSAAWGVSLPASTSFSNSVSISGANESRVTYKSHGSRVQFTFAVCPAALNSPRRDDKYLVLDRLSHWRVHCDWDRPLHVPPARSGINHDCCGATQRAVGARVTCI